MTAPPAAAVELIVTRETSGSRLDRLLAGALDVSRAELQRWIEAGRVSVDGRPRQAAAKVREGERVVVLPVAPRRSTALPDPGVEFETLYLDDDVVVVNKPAGLVVHPALGHPSGTLVNGLLAMGVFRAGDAEIGDDSAHVRPGIVHRLDKGTAGVMVVARTARAREALKAQFQMHTIDRAYEAIVVGQAVPGTLSTLHGRHPRDRLKFTTRVSTGRSAVTHVRILAALRGATHVECTLETGRTHQIRVHLSESGTPVLGDPLYGHPPRDARIREAAESLGHQALWARRLGFEHPRTGQRMTFESARPLDFLAALRALAPEA